MMIYKFFTGLFVTLMMATPLAMAQIPGSMDEPDTLPKVEKTGEKLNFTDNPCPDPREALGNTPNDLSVIQEDITRFNLCLQRSQLLNRLNDLAAENIDTIESTLDNRLEEIASEFTPEPMPMPEVSVPVIPQAPAIENPAPTVSQPQTMMPIQQEPIASSHWKISDIKGRGGVLVATLVDNGGNLHNLKQGDVVPDTKIRIVSVKPTTVQIKDGQDTRYLDWK